MRLLVLFLVLTLGGIDAQVVSAGGLVSSVAEEAYPEYADYTDPADTSVSTVPVTLATTTQPLITSTTTVTTSTTETPTSVSVVTANNSLLNSLKPQPVNSTQRFSGFPPNTQTGFPSSNQNQRFTPMKPTQRFPQNNYPQSMRPPRNQPVQKVVNPFRTGGVKEMTGQKFASKNAQDIKKQQEKVKKIANRRLKNLKKKIQKQQAQQNGSNKSRAQSNSKKITNHF